MLQQARRLSSGKKVAILQLLLCGLIAGLVALNFWFGTNQKGVLEQEAKLVARLGRVGELSVKIKQLQVDVIQVQQFLQDISATRGLDGYDEGPKLAEQHAKSFQTGVKSVEQEAQDLGLTEIVEALREVEAQFPKYYEIGKTMSAAYVSGGPMEGNKLMEPFDAAATKMGEALEQLVKVGSKVAATANNEAGDLRNETATFVSISLVVGLIAISVGVGAFIFARILARQASRQQKEAEKLREAQLASELSQAAATANVVKNLGEGLELLARGDLTCQLDQPFPEGFEKLRDYFNETTNKLSDALNIVRDGSSRIHQGTDEIAQASDDLSRRTENQAASLEQTAAAVQEISNSVRQTAERSALADVHAYKVSEGVQAGATIVDEAIIRMNGIKSSSNRMTQITHVIDEIAFQTNLLALNAGVEAARAGDAGRGFAVVAGEVRELSLRSATAAREIKSLLEESALEVDDGVSLIMKAGATLKDVKEVAHLIKTTVNELSTSAKSQALSLAEINVAIEQMDQVTQQNAAMVEQANAATVNLSQQTNELANLVSKFKTEALGQAA